MRLPPLHELLPAAPPMLWLDEVLSFEPEQQALTCRLTLRSDHPFVESGAVSALYAIEWMAQAAQVLRALCAKASGSEAKRYLLASVDEAHFDLDAFAVGDQLSIRAREHSDGRFACNVVRGDRERCSARLRFAER